MQFSQAAKPIARERPVILGKHSATRNPGRGLGFLARVNALDSRLRGNDGSVVSSGLNITAITMTVIPGKGSATRNLGRGLGFLARVNALDSRLRGNDGSVVSSGINITAITMTVIPGKGSATRNPGLPGTGKVSMMSCQRSGPLNPPIRGDFEGFSPPFLGAGGPA